MLRALIHPFLHKHALLCKLEASLILTTLATATLLAPATAPAGLDASPAAPASNLHTVLPAPPATALCVAVSCSDVPTLTESLYMS